MRIRRLTFFGLLCLIFIFGLLPLRPAQAQAGIVFSNMLVEVWPEYDKPATLVIYNITLSPQVTLPANLSLRIPAAAGKPFALAWESTDKALYDLKYETSNAGDWVTVTFSAPAPNVRLEYYDPSIKKSGAHRDLTFRWAGDYSVDSLSLNIQQPIQATNVTFRPDAGTGQVASDGLTYYSLMVGKVNAGTTFDLAIAYDKPNDTLTNPKQFQAAQSSQPIDSSTAGRVTLDQMLPWALGGAGMLLIAAGLFWYMRSGRTPVTAHAKRRHVSRQSSVSPMPPAEPISGETAFCQQCGKKAGPTDVFCRSCGTRLR